MWGCHRTHEQHTTHLLACAWLLWTGGAGRRALQAQAVVLVHAARSLPCYILSSVWLLLLSKLYQLLILVCVLQPQQRVQR
jgi:hypothetical protein